MTPFKTLAAAAALSLTMPVVAEAAGLAPGVYDVTDLDGFRSIWTPNGATPNSNAFVTGNGASGYWSFDQATLDFQDGTNASLTGSATNTGNDDLSFNFDLSFTLSGVGDEPGYCQFSGVDKGCTNGPYAGGDPSTWSYFDFDSGSMTGTGDMNGLSWTLADNPMHRAQAGEGANALEEYDLGFSMWFTWTLDGATGNVTQDGYTFNASGNGDFNVDLAAVPLPASVLLMLSALGAGALVSRRGARRDA